MIYFLCLECLELTSFISKAEYGDDDLPKLSISTFKLPSEFSQRLRNLSDQLYKDVGFQLIHGLDPTKYTSKQKIIVYAGVTAHVCPQRGYVDVFGKSVVGEHPFLIFR